MKNAFAAIVVTLMSIGGISCSKLLTKTPTATNGYAQPPQTGQSTQGGYYDQAQVYPQPGNAYGTPPGTGQQPASSGYQAPAPASTYDQQAYSPPAPPAPTYQQQAYTPPESTYTPPAYTGSSTSGQTHTVQKGENLYRISQMHGTTVQDLMSVNGLSSDVIYPGDVLTIR